MLRQLPSEVIWTLGGILCLLVLSSIVVSLLQWRKPDGDYRELTARLRTWWVIVLLFSLALWCTRGFTLAFFAFVSFLALKEYLSLIPTRRADRRVLFWAYLAVPVQYYLVYLQWYGLFIIFIPVYMFLILPIRTVMIGKTDGFVRAMGTVHWGLMTTVFSLSHAAFLLTLQVGRTGRVPHDSPSELGTLDPGPGLVLTLVLLTQFNDIAQYLWGKSLGRTRVVPTVSPGKTVAGLVGGVATTMVVATLIGPRLTTMDAPRSLVAGLLIGLGGFAGDVTISALKRDMGVKDSGSVLPGHGGILDRVDSLTYTAPLFFHYLYYLYF